MDASANPHTPPNPQAPGEAPRSSPLSWTPFSVGADGAGNQSSPAQRREAPDRKLGVKMFINSEQFSDITINYGPNGRSKFKAHKIILASSSLWFQAAFTNPSFTESDASELTLHDDDELATTIMLKSCYCPPTNAYDMLPPWTAAEKLTKRPGFSNSCLLFHVEVYVVADKYLMEQLRQRAAVHMGIFLKRYLEAIFAKRTSPAPTIAAVNIHECLTKIYAATVAGDENTPLRKAVTDVLMSHRTTRSTGEPGCMTAKVMRCAREIEGFGRDMYVRTMGEAAKLGSVAYLEVVEEVLCPSCQHRWMKPTGIAWSLVRCISCGVPSHSSSHTVAKAT
ncbi:hypothetical protein HBI25_105840 [Parastagonospora nodorum]|nr:hypothetical protein HBH51_173200 [Parastagonospora nodorum]KAH4121133.1 hypothetical protein HBH47_108900 [Parastagonospora nodorum]KAH4186823.1 hypothetical protein HBI95_237200 [Parastagonospora nodorum]KAH5374396.1 hypothetical protein HBI49_055850 [Parastagonospora nodorum]KAH5453110.1 hypothetical protein HBI30_103180 [Parastagonospora nodorum]